MKTTRVLIVDDEPGIRESLTGVLEDEGYSCSAVEGGEKCLKELGRNSYEVVLLDVWLGKFKRWRAGDAQALAHQLVASIPRVRLADGLSGRQNVPGRRRGRGERLALTLADAREEWL